MTLKICNESNSIWNFNNISDIARKYLQGLRKWTGNFSNGHILRQICVRMFMFLIVLSSEKKFPFVFFSCFFRKQGFESEILQRFQHQKQTLQRFRFWIMFSKPCQILNWKLNSVWDFEINFLRRVSFWKDSCIWKKQVWNWSIYYGKRRCFALWVGFSKHASQVYILQGVSLWMGKFQHCRISENVCCQ